MIQKQKIMWFEKLMGFKEENPAQVSANIDLQGNKLSSKVNGKTYTFGQLEVLTLAELIEQSPPREIYKSKIQVSEIVGNVQTFHTQKANNGAFFQAASQFNLLEMVNPRVIPEDGVGIYEHDLTQGPACAIACGAGTIYRNYFAPVGGKIGQTATQQIDCLEGIAVAFNNDKHKLWEMSNGYALATEEGLKNISEQIKSKSEKEYEVLKRQLKIGIQWDTEVTISENQNIVTQAYCSALPVAYSFVDADYWEDFARLILEATYEATFYAALSNYDKTGKPKVFLTLVGGGAFGNKKEWIFDAIRKAIIKFSNTPLEVKIVSYGQPDVEVREFVEEMNKNEGKRLYRKTKSK